MSTTPPIALICRQNWRFIPFPIDVKHAPVITDFAKVAFPPERPVRFFVGVQRSRSSYKGTDIMLRALRRLEAERPDEVQVVAVENLPFDEYKRAMLSCDVLLDQLYSYTPAMNALQAMAQGLVVVGGGEPESYDLLGCADLRPIVNVLPDENDVYENSVTWSIIKRASPNFRMRAACTQSAITII